MKILGQILLLPSLTLLAAAAAATTEAGSFSDPPQP
jgi:hypothetical protein